MKFIPKKQPGGLVARYLQANKYDLNQKVAPTMITPNPPYFTPEQTQAQLARQAQLQTEYNRSVVPTDISGISVTRRDGSYTHVPTMNVSQRPLTPRPTAVTPGPPVTPVTPVTPGSVSGIDNLIDLWKAGQTSQTPVAGPKWRMPIEDQVPAGTIDKMRIAREAAKAAKAVPETKTVTKPAPAPKPKAKVGMNETGAKKSNVPADTKRVGIGKNEKYVPKPEAINTGTSKNTTAKKPGTADGGFIGHAINQAMPGTTNQSSYRYPRIIEKVGNAAAGNPTAGSTAANLMPNNVVGSLLHWMMPKTTNAPKR